MDNKELEKIYVDIQKAIEPLKDFVGKEVTVLDYEKSTVESILLYGAELANSLRSIKSIPF